MFTGIVASTGQVVASHQVACGRRLTVRCDFTTDDIALGASVSVSGVCLTVTEVQEENLAFDVVAETLRQTTLGSKRVGDRVNLERSLRVGDRLDGHFVQGHIDGTAKVARVESSTREWLVWFRAPKEIGRYVIPKGSIAIDGVSLTIAGTEGDRFSVALIPTTLDATTLVDLRAGDVVNIETDIVTRTVVHQLEALRDGGSLTWENLRGAGLA